MENTAMNYGGTMGIPVLNEIMSGIDIAKVMLIHDELRMQNPLLTTPFDSGDVRHTIQQSMFCKLVNKTDVETAHRWYHNQAMTMDQVHPNAARHTFEDLIIGHDQRDHSRVTYKDRPAVLVEMFPYLYTEGRGYYSFESNVGNCATNDEPQGGVALANKRGMTLGAYAKQTVMMADRRFGSCLEYLFAMMDDIEKHNIHSYARHAVPTVPGMTYTREMLTDGNDFLPESTSFVPHTIRSSFAHKRKHQLNLSCIFENLGSPQLFLTFTCYDFAEYYRKKPLVPGQDPTDIDQPWDDPVLFADKFRRNFQQMFKQYILKGVSCLG